MARYPQFRSYVLFNLRLNYSINEANLDGTYRLAWKLFALDIILLSFLLSVYYIIVDICTKHEVN